MLFRDSVLLERIFNVFDTNHDNGINFLEFISCLSTLSTKASPEEKIRCMNLFPSPISLSLPLTTTHTVSFSIYDYDCDGFISKEELGHMLAATMREHEIILSPADVEGIIHSTFAEVRPSNPDKISFEE
jgi:serine/threonine-protein phosphatase 2B regulatory subunit